MEQMKTFYSITEITIEDVEVVFTEYYETMEQARERFDQLVNQNTINMESSYKIILHSGMWTGTSFTPYYGPELTWTLEGGIKESYSQN